MNQYITDIAVSTLCRHADMDAPLTMLDVGSNRGSFARAFLADPAVLILRYDWRNNACVFVHNLAGEPREIRFRAGPDPGHSPARSGVLINVLSEDHSQADAKGAHTVLMEPYGYRWYRVGGLDYILRRAEA